MEHLDAAWVSPGSISVEVQGGRRILCLAGEIDVTVVERFQFDQGSQVIEIDAIDAGAVSFMSAAGVELMLLWSQQSAALGRPPVLSRSSSSVDRVLELTNLGDAFVRMPGINGSE